MDRAVFRKYALAFCAVQRILVQCGMRSLRVSLPSLGVSSLDLGRSIILNGLFFACRLNSEGQEAGGEEPRAEFCNRRIFRGLELSLSSTI